MEVEIIRRNVAKAFVQHYPETQVDYLSVCRDLSTSVENNKIDIEELGIEPEVFVNRNTSDNPITEESNDTTNSNEKALDSFDSANSVVSDLQELEFNRQRVRLTTEGHIRAVKRKFAERSAYNFTPVKDTPNTPVVATVAEIRDKDGKLMNNSTNEEGFYMFSFEAIKMQAKVYDKLGVPNGNRHLCISNTHYWDLDTLYGKERLEKYNEGGQVAGAIAKWYGFNIWRYTGNVFYNPVTKMKVAWGAAPPAVLSPVSFTFEAEACFMAQGDIDIFVTPRLQNNTVRKSTIGTQMRGIAAPFGQRHVGAIYSQPKP